MVAAAGLIRKGRTFSLALNFDRNGPQKGLWGNRFNPIHTMLATGTDAVSGTQDEGGIRYADDMVSLPLQCGTQWDALGHIFYDDKMWNGYDARLVDSGGAQKNGIEKVKDKMAGRGVLLDVARHCGVDFFEDGTAIVNRDLDEDGRGAGGRDPARRFRDRPHRADGAAPRHRRMGRLCGRRRAGARLRDGGLDPSKGNRRDLHRYLGLRGPAQRDHRGAAALALGGDPDDRHHDGRDLRTSRTSADDCAEDGVYEFFFCAPPLPITKAVGSPLNPIAIK